MNSRFFSFILFFFFVNRIVERFVSASGCCGCVQMDPLNVWVLLISICLCSPMAVQFILINSMVCYKCETSRVWFHAEQKLHLFISVWLSYLKHLNSTNIRPIGWFCVKLILHDVLHHLFLPTDHTTFRSYTDTHTYIIRHKVCPS